LSQVLASWRESRDNKATKTKRNEVLKPRKRNEEDKGKIIFLEKRPDVEI